MLVAQDDGRMLLLTEQVKKSTLTLSAGYKQMIDKPNHVVHNSTSCIILLFDNNQNMITYYGVDVSISDKCHHNIILVQINICVALLPVYVR